MNEALNNAYALFCNGTGPSEVHICYNPSRFADFEKFQQTSLTLKHPLGYVRRMRMCTE